MTGPGEAPASEAASTRPVGAFIYDLSDERCVFCSGFFAALHGLEVEACRRLAPGERVSRFVHPEDQERYRRIVGHARAMRAPYDIAYRLVQPDGRVLDVQEAAEPWQDGESGQWRLVGFAEDVTRSRWAGSGGLPGFWWPPRRPQSTDVADAVKRMPEGSRWRPRGRPQAPLVAGPRD